VNYMTPKEAAEKWGIGLRQVQYLCVNNRIPGVQHVSRRWLIPVNAEHPKRTADGFATEDEAYHFPLLVYTDSYAAPRTLSEEEQALLDAQVLSLQGSHAESVRLCRELADATLRPSVKFGAYAMCSYGYTMLGLCAEVRACRTAMEHICAQDAAHAEDYRLLLAASTFQNTHDVSEFLRIDPDKLSPDALIFYQCISVLSLLFCTTEVSGYTIRLAAAFCRRVEESGVYPAALVTHSVLAVLCARSGDLSGQQKHIAAACRIGHDRALYSLLAKYSAMNYSECRKAFAQYGPEFADRLDQLHHHNFYGWKLIFNDATGARLYLSRTPEENEHLLLLSFGLSDKAIAQLKQITEEEVADAVRQMCRQYGIRSRAKLVAFARRSFDAAGADQG